MFNFSTHELPNVIKKNKKFIIWFVFVSGCIIGLAKLLQSFDYLNDKFKITKTDEPARQPFDDLSPQQKSDSLVYDSDTIESDIPYIHFDTLKNEERQSIALDTTNCDSVLIKKTKYIEVDEATLLAEQEKRIALVKSLLNNKDPIKRCEGFNELWSLLINSGDVRLYNILECHAQKSHNKRLTKNTKYQNLLNNDIRKVLTLIRLERYEDYGLLKASIEFGELSAPLQEYIEEVMILECDD